MKFHALSLGLALNAAVSSALKIPVRHAKRAVMQRQSGGASVSVSSLNSSLLTFLCDQHRALVALVSMLLPRSTYIGYFECESWFAELLYYSDYQDIIYIGNVSAVHVHMVSI
jgi:hypothetical protein